MDDELFESDSNDSETSSLTQTLSAFNTASTLCSDTTVDSELDDNSATPSHVCSLTVKLGEPYIHISRYLLMEKIKRKYGVLFPFWVCECTTVPRDSERKPHPSQYYPLRSQQQAWREWQEMNPYDIDPGGEISLNAIEWHSDNPDDAPPFHLWYLIMAAIHGSPMKRLTENEIKLSLIRRFYYFAFRQPNSADSDCVDRWIENVSNELQQNTLFSKSYIFKQDQDNYDSNYYWTLTSLPLDPISFHPQSQCLENIQHQRHAQDVQERVMITPHPMPSDNHPFRKCPKIPISMLVHPADCNTFDPKIIQVSAHNIDTWFWLSS